MAAEGEGAVAHPGDDAEGEEEDEVEEAPGFAAEVELVAEGAEMAGFGEGFGR